MCVCVSRFLIFEGDVDEKELYVLVNLDKHM